MGAEGAVSVLYRREISASEDPAAERAAKMAEYDEEFANPYEAAARGLVDDVIEPGDTRSTSQLGARGDEIQTRASRPQKKHGLIPL
jgi:propionyl-CoA carboxylase beta chain